MLRAVLHRAVCAFQNLRRILWFFTRPATFGVHAVPITPAGKLVLVKLSYASGWRLPGGGRKRGEAADAAMLRELREEIGLISCESLRSVTQFEHRPDFRKDQSRLFVAQGVVYRPRWSLEIKAVQEFTLGALPSDTAPITRRLLNAARPILS